MGNSFVPFCAAAFLTASASCAAWGGAPAPAGKYKGYNVIMISLSNVGTQHMGLYGYKRGTTPNIDRWAAEALIFEDAFTPASWTLPVATSLFTSLYPYSHRIMGRYRENSLAKSIKTLPEIMKAFGYRTAAFTGGLDYMRSFRHMRGFETVADNPPFTPFDVVIPQARDWLAKNSGSSFFLLLHGYDAHPPFTPSGRFRGVFSSTESGKATVDNTLVLRGYRNTDGKYTAAYYGSSRIFSNDAESGETGKKEIVLTQDDIDYLRDLYDEEVLETDQKVGQFLASLDKELLAKTILVIYSDHGEMFAKHGRFGRAGTIRGTLYDDVLHIPLLIRLPGVPGRRLGGLVQLIDVMPTLLALLDIPAPGRIQGRDLAPLINERRQVNDYVYAGGGYNLAAFELFPQYPVGSINEAIRNSAWKLIREVKFSVFDKSGEPEKGEEVLELYDLKRDPEELTDLAAAQPEVVRSLKKELSDWAGSAGNFMRAGPSTRKVPDEVREKAKKHGYW